MWVFFVGLLGRKILIKYWDFMCVVEGSVVLDLDINKFFVLVFKI